MNDELQNVYEGELLPDANIRKLRIVQEEGAGSPEGGLYSCLI